MVKLSTIWRWIVGRIKKNMVAIIMGLIGIFFPIGGAFFLVAFQAGTFKDSWYYMVAGLIFWGIGIYLWTELRNVYQDEESKNDAKYLTQLEVLNSIRTDIKSPIDELIKEIRQERNERNNRDKK